MNLLKDFLKDLIQSIYSNEEDLRISDKARDKIDPKTWWKNRKNYEQRIKNSLNSIDSVFNPFLHIFANPSNEIEINQ